MIVAKELVDRYAEAYVMMADGAKYRPQAPGDGRGNINLTDRQLADRTRLEREAIEYGCSFANEENTEFAIGYSRFETNRAFVFAIEAARLMAGCDDERALKILALATKELETVIADKKARQRKRAAIERAGGLADKIA
jgi:hypothetical protein